MERSPFRLSARQSIALVLCAALAVRLVGASRLGLVLDEMHTLFHARNAGTRDFWVMLVRDNHPPLSFLVIGLVRRVLGESELALRLPSLAFGLAELALLARLARPLGYRGRILAVALLAASSLHLEYSTRARMYSLLGLAVTGFTLTVVRELSSDGRGKGRARWMTALWIVIGFHTHYYFVPYAAGISVGMLAAAAGHPETRARVRALIPPAALGVLLCLPWALTGFRAQLGTGLPPGGDDVGLAATGEAMMHLVFLNLRLGAPLLRLVFIACAGIVLALGALGAAALVRDSNRRILGFVCAASAFGVPLTMSVVASVWPRAGFTWYYVLPSAAPMAVLATAGSFGVAQRLRQAALVFALANASLLSILNVASRGSEDYPGAVRRILAEHRPGDVVVSVEWEPALFPQGLPWDYYAPRLSPNPPERLPMGAFDVVDATAMLKAERVLLLRSSLPENHPLLLRLRKEFNEIAVEGYGFGRWVHVFARR